MRKVSKLMLIVLSLVIIMTVPFIMVGCDKEEANDNATKTFEVVKHVAASFYDGVKITWNELTDVASYDVIINGEKVATVNDPEYTVDVEEETLDVRIDAYYYNPNTYEYEVDTGDTINYTYKTCYFEPDVNYGVVSWDTVEGAEGYLVKIGTNQPVRVDKNSYSEFPTGASTIRVKPIMSKDSQAYYTYSAPKSIDIIASPVLNFNKATNTIYWDSVSDAAGYKILIQKDGEDCVDIPVFGANATSYNEFKFQDAGKYTVKIAAKGDSQANKNDSRFYSMNIERLSAPTALYIKDDSSSVLISWPEVKGATKYFVELPSGAITETSDFFYRYPLEDSMYEQSLKFRVYSASINDKVLDSFDYIENIATRLAAVSNIKLQDGYVTWEEVPKAEYYTIYVDGEEDDLDGLQYLLDIAPGDHIVKIKAIGNGKEIVSSMYSEEKTITKLTTPTKLSISSYVLSWDAVEGTNSYSIILENGNVLKNSNINSVLINPSEIKESTSLSVVARGNGSDVCDSNQSATKMLYLLDTPTVSVTQDGINWKPLLHATSYKISVGEYEKNITGSSLSLEEFNPDYYSISVTAIGDGATYFDSKETQKITVKKLASTAFELQDNGIKWPTVAGAAAYQIRIDGSTPVMVDPSIREYVINLQTAGKHIISQRAIGDGVESVNSSWTTKEVLTQLLPTPASFSVDIVGQDLTITCEEVENASGYKFKIGGVIYTSETNQYTYTINNPTAFVISVAAAGNGFTYVDSIFGVEEVFTLLPDVKPITFVKQGDDVYSIKWTQVQNATNYSIQIIKHTSLGEDDYPDVINTLKASAAIDVDVEGYVKIDVSVIAKGDNEVTFDSKAVTATKLLVA